MGPFSLEFFGGAIERQRSIRVLERRERQGSPRTAKKPYILERFGAFGAES